MHSGAPKPACRCCPCQGDWLETPSLPALQGFTLHAVQGSCVAQLGFSKGVIQSCCSFLLIQAEFEPKLMSEVMPRAAGEGQTRSTLENHCSIMHLHCAKTKPRPEHCDLPKADASL